MPGRHIYWREAVILSKQGRVVDDTDPSLKW